MTVKLNHPPTSSKKRPFSALDFGSLTNIPNAELVEAAERIAFAPGMMLRRTPYRLSGEWKAALPTDLWAVVFAVTGGAQGFMVAPNEVFLCLSEAFVWNDRIYIEVLHKEQVGFMWISLPGAVVPVSESND